ncbi:hypothetical protein AAF712_015158 [Marasmius tenuissimus]|uniref:Uncharacterized protein n=1 Tax=Marasmius tenuissimus TaxID=585030 RepID=A0ABR2Z9B1_9AGAR
MDELTYDYYAEKPFEESQHPYLSDYDSDEYEASQQTEWEVKNALQHRKTLYGNPDRERCKDSESTTSKVKLEVDDTDPLDSFPMPRSSGFAAIEANRRVFDSGIFNDDVSSAVSRRTLFARTGFTEYFPKYCN